jgi:hypothetical protein
MMDSILDFFVARADAASTSMAGASPAAGGNSMFLPLMLVFFVVFFYSLASAGETR